LEAKKDQLLGPVSNFMLESLIKKGRAVATCGMTGIRLLADGEISVFTTTSKLLLGPTQPPKAVETSINAEVKNTWSLSPMSHKPLWNGA
jgi:hypothetical protein